MSTNNAARPTELQTKTYTAPDGSLVEMKVVREDSPTFGLDLQAAFRSNVRRIREAQRETRRAVAHTAKA